MEYFSHSWLPFLYLYGLGGLLFTAGIIITIKSGSLDLKNISHWRWFWTLIFGLIWYMSLHASLTLAALNLISSAFILMGCVIIISIFGAFQVINRKRIK
jgi:hypothetical protein